jgi:DNA invertase Pin-like site-specific DNA recombinase
MNGTTRALSYIELSRTTGGNRVKAAIYARVSTDLQSPEMQVFELREYCRRRGCEVAGEFIDLAVSGSRESRPALNRLWADARRRRFDAVVVYRYDRFARSLRQLVSALDEFRGLGIDFVSLHEGVDTSTPNGRLVFGIFATIAEFERELIRERVRAGMRNARAKGKQIGRRRAVFDADQARSLLASGQSLAQVGAIMGVSASTVWRRLDR